MRFSHVAAVAILLAAGLVPQISVEGQGSGAANEEPWWPNPDLELAHFREGWNLRIPLTLLEPRSYLPGVPVQVHLDLGKALTGARGDWPDRGGHPAMFNAVPESVRLVRYTPGEAGELVPFWMTTTWLEPDQETAWQKTQTSPFHDQRNPVVTLEWLLPDLDGAGAGPSLQQNQPQHYMVYFDITQNGITENGGQGDVKNIPAREAHPTQAIPDPWQRLDGLYWVGAGTTLHGRYSQSTNENRLMVFSTQPGATTATVTVGSRTTDLTFTGVGQVREHSLGLSHTHFRVDANQPVTVMLHSLDPIPPGGSNERSKNQAFVPSNEAGLLGHTFTVPATSQWGYYVIDSVDGSHMQTQRYISNTWGCSGGPEGNCPNPFTGQLPTPPDTTPLTARDLVDTSTIGHINGGNPGIVQLINYRADQMPTQVPGRNGSPVDQDFFSATTRGYDGFQANSWEGPTFFRVDGKGSPSLASPESYTGLGVRYAPCPDGEDCRAIARGWDRPVEWIRTTAGVDEDGEPVSRRDVTLLSAESGSIQYTPFGGIHGMDFQIPGDFHLYSFYDRTRINITYSDGTVEEDVIGREGMSKTYDASGITRLKADKPVSAFPIGVSGDYAFYLSSKPGFLVPQIGHGEFRGYVFDVTPTQGDPVFLNGLQGDTLDAPFTVQNLARWDGAPVPDTISFDASVTVECPDALEDPDLCPDGADVQFDHGTMTLDDAIERRNVVHVSLPEDTPSDTRFNVRVTAQSGGNALMKQSFDVIIVVKQVFKVEMWFGHPGEQSQTTQESLSAQLGEEHTFPFALRNAGSSVDSFDLTMGAPEGGWSAWITTPERQPLSRVTDLDPGEAVGAILHVRVPQTMEVVTTSVTIDAVSVTSPQASDRLGLSAGLDLIKDVDMHVDEVSRLIDPGTSEIFDVDIINTGEDSINLVTSIEAQIPDGWEVALDGLGGAPFALFPPSETSPDRNRATVPVRITAPADAAADVFLPVLLRTEVAGRTPGEVAAQEAVSLSVTVRQVHGLVVEAPHDLVVAPGGTLAFNVTVTNTGNGADTVLILPAALPGGWTFTQRGGTAELAAGQSASVEVEVGAPARESPAPVDLQLLARSGGPTFPFSASLDVQEVRLLAWRTPTPTLAQPGDTPGSVLHLENRGNVAERVRVQATGPWAVRAPADAFHIPAQSVRSVSVEWDVPPEATGGNESLRFTARSDRGTTHAVDLPVEVDTPRLEAEDVLLTTAPRGDGSVGSVMVVLRNPSTVPFRDAEVRLVATAVGGDPVIVDRVPFGSVGPDGTVIAPLHWVEGEDARPDRVEWGVSRADAFEPAGTAPVPDRVAVDTDKDVPFPLAILALAAVLAARRRGVA